MKNILTSAVQYLDQSLRLVVRLTVNKTCLVENTLHMNIKCDRQNTAQQQHVWVPTVLINTSICESAWIWIWADWSPEIHHNIHPSSKTHYRSLLKWSCWKFQLFLKITQSMCTSSLTQRKSAVPTQLLPTVFRSIYAGCLGTFPSIPPQKGEQIAS